MTNNEKQPETVELDAATKARIRAEEVERAKVRAELAGTTPLPIPPAPVQKSGGIGCFGWVALTLIGIIAFFVFTAITTAGSRPDRFQLQFDDPGHFRLASIHSAW